jgi:hypothetical protein
MQTRSPGRAAPQTVSGVEHAGHAAPQTVSGVEHAGHAAPQTVSAGARACRPSREQRYLEPPLDPSEITA